MNEFIQNNLSELASEILDFHNTGLLHNGTGGRVRELARLFQAEHIGIDFSQALAVAESMIKDEALKKVL